MGRRDSIGRESTERRKGYSILGIKMQGTNRSGEGGEKSLLCHPGSELRPGARERKKKGEDNT